jgi:hypothetical protein
MSAFNEDQSQFAPGTPFQFTSLTNTDRQDIIELSANFNLNGAAYVQVNELDLSALGTTADLIGQWNHVPEGNQPAIDLIAWRHIAVTGRDVYVRIVRKGYLFPLGHEAAIIQIVERVILEDPTQSSFADAYLQQETYIRVTQQVKGYPALGQPFGTNDWPFTSVRLLTAVSPLLDTPIPTLVSDGQAVLPTSAGTPVQWTFIATDLAGNEVHLQMPLYFMYAADTASGWGDEFDTTITQPIVDAYNAATSANRSADGHGAPLRFAPEAGGPAGGTTHPLLNITLGAASATNDPNTSATVSSPPNPTTLESVLQPAFYPVISSSAVQLKAADALTKGSFSDGNGPGVTIQFYGDYVSGGLPESTVQLSAGTEQRAAAGGQIVRAASLPANNAGGVYAQLASAVTSGQQAPLLGFPSDTVGGLANPNTYLGGLSALAGAVGVDPSSAASALSSLQNYAQTGAAAAGDFFKSLENQAQSSLSQLLGGLHLGDILGDFVNMLGGIPNMTSNFDKQTNTLTVTYQLQAALQNWGPGAGDIFVPNSGGKLTLTATATISASGKATYDVKGSIDPFTIYLVDNSSADEIIQIPFNKLSFDASNGAKPKVDVSIGTVSFQGVLEFVNDLESFLQDLGGSGLSISVTPTEVDAGFTLSIPPVGIGILNLEGISFSAGISVPFLGDPAVATFGFASQDNPFTLTVMMFGGGGFFSIGLGFGGIQTISAQFEFAGQLAIDLGVASGGVTVAAGIYYSYTATGDSTTLTGFVRITGELSVLGLISISAELDLELTYQKTDGQSYVEGTASLSVSISICFFSISVSVSVHKQFAGSNSGDANSVRQAALRAAEQPAITGLPVTPPTVSPVLFDQIMTQQNWDNYISAFAA